MREPQRVFELTYRDPDGDDIALDLTFTAVMDPLSTKTSGPNGGHLDQLGRFTGTLVLDGEIDRGRLVRRARPVVGSAQPVRPVPHVVGRTYTATEMPYSHATSDTASFQAITANVTDDYPMIMGFFLRDGEVSRLTTGRRAILARDPATDTVTRVLVEGTDELGREFHAEGETVSRFVNFCNENLVGWNYLVRWEHRRSRGVGRAARELQHRRVPEVPQGARRVTRYEELMPELLRPWVSQVPTPEAFVVLNQLGEISRRVSAAYGQFLRPHGIDFSEYVLLWALRLHHPRAPAMSELRGRVVMSSGGIALAANRLERKGLARRRAAPNDGRTVLLAITAKGRRLIDGLMAEDLERHEHLLSALAPRRRIEVLDGLAEILQRLIDTAEPP